MFLLNHSRMNGLTCLVLLLVLKIQGRTLNQCEATDRETLKCTFSENINSTQRDFEVYFYSENDDQVVLVDCIWELHKLRCIMQEGFYLKTPVSEFVELNVAERFFNQSGTYKCIPGGYTSDNIKPCQSHKSDNKRQKETPHQTEGSSAPAVKWIVPTVVVTCFILVVVLVLILVLYFRRRKERRTEPVEKKQRLIANI